MDNLTFGNAGPAEQPASDKSAVFESLTIKRAGCPTYITMVPEGIWVCGPHPGLAASLHFQGGVPVVAVMDHRKQSQSGHQLALFTDAETGKPCLQISHGRECRTVSYEELLKALCPNS